MTDTASIRGLRCAGLRCRTRASEEGSRAALEKKGRDVAHQFLSDAWIDAALELREEYLGRIPVPDQTITMNQVITEHPFGSDAIEMHLDTSDGVPKIDRGHIDGADVTVSTDWPNFI